MYSILETGLAGLTERLKGVDGWRCRKRRISDGCWCYLLKLRRPREEEVWDRDVGRESSSG